MSANLKPAAPPPLDLSKWRNVPNWLIGAGLVLAATGAATNLKQFGYSWLLAFMLYLSLCLGALFLVMMHHLFDAGWSVPIRRFCEHIAGLLFPWMGLFFVPIALLAPQIYPWMTVEAQRDDAVQAKWPFFTKPMFYAMAAACFAVWWLLSAKLRYWSLKQDEDGAAKCTYRLRFHSAWGTFAFALTLTLAAVMWLKALQHQWLSTMYGVYYFAGSVWLTLATVYVITMILDRQNLIREVLHEHQYYFIASLLFAFTVFYAYIHYAQYFIIWNANMPEETFWYVVREKGSWYHVGLLIIFGHFFLPFLCLLRMDVKHVFSVMVPLCMWAWLMHFFDLSFNIMPVLHPDGFPLRWLWLDAGCVALIGGVLAKVFLKNFAAHAPYPQKDPRGCEAMGFDYPVPAAISGGVLDEADEELESNAQIQGGGK